MFHFFIFGVVSFFNNVYAADGNSCKEAKYFLYANQSSLTIPELFHVNKSGPDCLKINNSSNLSFNVKEKNGKLLQDLPSSVDWIEVVTKADKTQYYAVNVKKIANIPEVKKSINEKGYSSIVLIEGCKSDSTKKEYFIVESKKEGCSGIKK